MYIVDICFSGFSFLTGLKRFFNVPTIDKWISLMLRICRMFKNFYTICDVHGYLKKLI